VIIEATAIRIRGDDIDTDVRYPGPFLNIEDPDQMKNHLFEGLDPLLRNRLVGHTALILDANFGSGSSREHVVRSMKASGVRCVIGKSFARIFYRNCINLGLLAIPAPEIVERVADHARLRVDLEAETVTVEGQVLAIPPLHPFILEAVRCGGFVEWARQHSPVPVPAAPSRGARILGGNQ
jgi:3-isopropylmalate/(R)-2-methylmalate dehydratase small subunit